MFVLPRDHQEFHTYKKNNLSDILPTLQMSVQGNCSWWGADLNRRPWTPGEGDAAMHLPPEGPLAKLVRFWRYCEAGQTAAVRRCLRWLRWINVSVDTDEAIPEDAKQISTAIATKNGAHVTCHDIMR
ncbi:hypothetical protein FQR65_LT10412 [Abscondita terminalis]|nr:hypothetical protein FQR65_LT10412 [Abscondita terminalis]